MKKLLPQAFLLLLLLISNYVAEAQPGYQGRKFSIQSNLLFLPAISHASYNKEPGIDNFNITGEASLDYVLSKRNSIGVSFKNFRTSNMINGDQTGISPYKLHANSVGLQYRFYKNRTGNIAPLGKYLQVGAGVLFCQLKDSRVSGAGTPFRMYALRIGAAKNRIFFNRLIFMYGWEINHLLPEKAKDEDDFIGGATVFDPESIQSMAHHRLWMHSLFNLKVGLGFLAF